MINLSLTARKVQRFLSQPFFVAGQFIMPEGKYVPPQKTVRGFKEILEGKKNMMMFQKVT